jgi:3-hydroxyacyl-CoA dehydrogenase
MYQWAHLSWQILLGWTHVLPLCGNSRIHQVDVKSYVLRVLHTELGDSKYRPSPLLIKYVDAGWLGNLYLLVYIRGKERERDTTLENSLF